jgi:hypothetical protein
MTKTYSDWRVFFVLVVTTFLVVHIEDLILWFIRLVLF